MLMFVDYIWEYFAFNRKQLPIRELNWNWCAFWNKIFFPMEGQFNVKNSQIFEPTTG